MELQPGSVEAIADELRASGIAREVRTTDQANIFLTWFKNSCMNIRVSVSRFLASLVPRRKQPILPETEPVETQPQLPVGDPLWLLFCINGSNLATLQHLDLCKTKSDYELFTCLKTRYLFLRSKMVFARRLFLGLSKIHFVQVSALNLCRMVLFMFFSFSSYPVRMLMDSRLAGYLLQKGWIMFIKRWHQNLLFLLNGCCMFISTP